LIAAWHHATSLFFTMDLRPPATSLLHRPRATNRPRDRRQRVRDRPFAVDVVAEAALYRRYLGVDGLSGVHVRLEAGLPRPTNFTPWPMVEVAAVGPHPAGRRIAGMDDRSTPTKWMAPIWQTPPRH